MDVQYIEQDDADWVLYNEKVQVAIFFYKKTIRGKCFLTSWGMELKKRVWSQINSVNIVRFQLTIIILAFLSF